MFVTDILNNQQFWDDNLGYPHDLENLHSSPSTGEVEEKWNHSRHLAVKKRQAAEHFGYPLVICCGLLLKMAIEIVDLAIKMVTFHSCISLPEGMGISYF